MAKIAVTLESVEDRLRRAHKAAKRADSLSGALFDRRAPRIVIEGAL